MTSEQLEEAGLGPLAHMYVRDLHTNQETPFHSKGYAGNPDGFFEISLSGNQLNLLIHHFMEVVDPTLKGKLIPLPGNLRSRV